MTGRHQPVAGRWSVALVARWVRSYTLGLPAGVREERRDEIASDLWEQARDDAGRSTVAVEILTRGVLGAPADLAWRLERSRLSQLPGWLIASVLGVLSRLESVGRWLARRGLPGFTTAAGAAAGLIGVLVVVTAPSNDSGTPTTTLVWWGTLLILGALSVGVGGRLIGARARLGAGLIFLGSGLLGLLLWPTVIAPGIALSLSWRAAIRVRDDWRDRDQIDL